MGKLGKHCAQQHGAVERLTLSFTTYHAAFFGMKFLALLGGFSLSTRSGEKVERDPSVKMGRFEEWLRRFVCGTHLHEQKDLDALVATCMGGKRSDRASKSASRGPKDIMAGERRTQDKAKDRKRDRGKELGTRRAASTKTMLCPAKAHFFAPAKKPDEKPGFNEAVVR